MVDRISGYRGPLAPGSVPGWFGYNTAKNVEHFQQLGIQALDRKDTSVLARLAAADIQYHPGQLPPQTPAEIQQQMLDENARAYAQVDLINLSRNNIPIVDRLDLQNALNNPAQPDAADRFLSAMDVNGDGVIDANESAAFLKFSDNAPQFMAGALNDLANLYGSNSYPQSPTQPISPLDLADLKLQALAYSQIPSKFDGTVTGPERYAAEQAVLKYPTLVKMTLNELIQGMTGQSAISPFRV